MDLSKNRVAIINGVNLSKIGTREINIYGETHFVDYLKMLREKYHNEIAYFQSDKIDEIVEALFKYADYDGIILNPGAYTHTAIVLADTIKAIEAPVIEVHISNLFGREQYRRKSSIASACCGFISGFGLKGYEMALLSFKL